MNPVYLIIGLICGSIAAVIASNKGRSGIGWFFFGFVFGIIGIIIITVLSDLNVEKERDEERKLEIHRLRERVKQEKLKNEAFRKYTVKRIDLHDDVLGIETRALQGSSQSSNLLKNNKSNAVLPPKTPSVRRWYYNLNGKILEPVSENEIIALLYLKDIEGTTLLRIEGLSDWKPANQISIFSSVINS